MKVADICDGLSHTLRINIIKNIGQSSKHFETLRFAFNLNNNTLTFHLNKLVYCGILKKDDGLYQITDTGRASLVFLDKLEKYVKGDNRKIRKKR